MIKRIDLGKPDADMMDVYALAYECIKTHPFPRTAIQIAKQNYDIVTISLHPSFPPTEPDLGVKEPSLDAGLISVVGNLVPSGKEYRESREGKVVYHGSKPEDLKVWQIAIISAAWGFKHIKLELLILRAEAEEYLTGLANYMERELDAMQSKSETTKAAKDAANERTVEIGGDLIVGDKINRDKYVASFHPKRSLA